MLMPKSSRFDKKIWQGKAMVSRRVLKSRPWNLPVADWVSTTTPYHVVWGREDLVVQWCPEAGNAAGFGYVLLEREIQRCTEPWKHCEFADHQVAWSAGQQLF